MNAYRVNLKRLEKATKLTKLAYQSGTLRDKDWSKASFGMVLGALHLLEEAHLRQRVYVDGKES